MGRIKTFPTSVTTTSATYTDLAQYKNCLRVESGNIYRLAKAGESLAIGGVLMPHATVPLDGAVTDAAGCGLIVILTTGVAVPVVGANATGALVTSGHYFWMLVDGIATILGNDNCAAGVKIMPAAAAGGRVDIYAAAANAPANTCCGMTIDAHGATATFYTTCWFQAGIAGSALAA